MYNPTRTYEQALRTKVESGKIPAIKRSINLYNEVTEANLSLVMVYHNGEFLILDCYIPYAADKLGIYTHIEEWGLALVLWVYEAAMPKLKPLKDIQTEKDGEEEDLGGLVGVMLEDIDNWDVGGLEKQAKEVTHKTCIVDALARIIEDYTNPALVKNLVVRLNRIEEFELVPLDAEAEVAAIRLCLVWDGS